MRVSLFPKQLTISLSEKSYSTIKEISDEQNISMAECMRSLIEQVLPKKNPEKKDIFDDLPF